MYELTGEPLSAWFARAATQSLPFTPVKLILEPPSREVLRERIAQRFHAMLAQGLVAEVEALYQRGDLHADLPAIRAVGYRQVWSYLEGIFDYETMVERGIIATRQFAKRQVSWLRSESAPRFDVTAMNIRDQVLKYLAANAIS